MADDRYARAPGTSSMANGGRNIRARIQAIARDTLDAETSSAPQALVFAGPFSYPLGSQTLETPPPEIDRNFEWQSSIFRK